VVPKKCPSQLSLLTIEPPLASARAFSSNFERDGTPWTLFPLFRAIGLLCSPSLPATILGTGVFSILDALLLKWPYTVARRPEILGFPVKCRVLHSNGLLPVLGPLRFLCFPLRLRLLDVQRPPRSEKRCGYFYAKAGRIRDVFTLETVFFSSST